MTRTTLAVAADYADAMLVARFWRSVMFLLLFLILLLQIGIFCGVRYYTTPVAGAVVIGSATQPSVLGNHDWGSGLAWLTNVTVFAAVVCVIVLAVLLLLIIAIMLVGRLIGVTHVTRAFVWCVVLAALLFPWQSLWNYPINGTVQIQPPAEENLQVGPPVALPGVLYTWPELQHKSHFANQPPTAAILGWARFVGWPVVAIFILLTIQARSSRGLKFALGEAEIQVVETGAKFGPPGGVQ